MQDTKEIVGFYKILKQVSQEAHSQYAKDRIFNDKLTPYLEVAQQKQAETIEATTILDVGLTIPFMGLSQIEHLTQVVEKGLILEPAECVEYADFLRSARLIKAFLTKNKLLAPNLAAYSEILGDFTAVEQEIYGLIQNGKLIDEASRELKKIRKQIKQNKEAIDQKLKKFINHSTNRDKIQEPVVVEKQGRLTVPIKSTYKRQVQGTLVVESSKLQHTLIIELLSFEDSKFEEETLKYLIFILDTFTNGSLIKSKEILMSIIDRSEPLLPDFKRRLKNINYKGCIDNKIENNTQRDWYYSLTKMAEQESKTIDNKKLMLSILHMFINRCGPNLKISENQIYKGLLSIINHSI